MAAGLARLGAADRGERLEQFRLALGRDAGAGVGDGDQQAVVLVAHHRDGDFALVGELGGVAEQVDEDLRDPPAVRRDRAAVRRQKQDQVVAVGRDRGPLQGGDFLDQRRHLERLGIDLEILALDLLAGQDVADQADQVLGGGFDGGELVLPAGSVGRHLRLAQELGVAVDGVEGVLQLVGQDGHEAALGVAVGAHGVRGLGRALGAVQSFRRHRPGSTQALQIRPFGCPVVLRHARSFRSHAFPNRQGPAKPLILMHQSIPKC